MTDSTWISLTPGELVAMTNTARSLYFTEPAPSSPPLKDDLVLPPVPAAHIRDLTAEIIEGAIALLRDCGWCQGTTLDNRGRMCMAGALAAASFGLAWVHGDGIYQRYLSLRNHSRFTAHQWATSLVMEQIRKDNPDDGWALPSIPAFNDLPDTTEEDALLIFKKAAEKARQPMIIDEDTP